MKKLNVLLPVILTTASSVIRLITSIVDARNDQKQLRIRLEAIPSDERVDRPAFVIEKGGIRREL